MTDSPERPPLRFVVPPTWPVPSAAWIARNQGWSPPRGWLPPGSVVGETDLAPARWGFWQPDETVWPTLRQPFVRHARRAIVAGWLMIVVGSAFSIAGYLGILGGGFVLLFGLVVAGVVRVLTGYRDLGRVDVAVWDRLGRRVQASVAVGGFEAWNDAVDGPTPEQAREHLLTTRVDPASTERVPFPAGWQIVRWAEEPPWVSQDPEAAPKRRRRLGIAAGAGVALIAAVAIPLALSPTHTLTDQAGPSRASVAARHSPSAQLYSLPYDDWSVVDSGKCTGSDGCWQIQVDPETSCRAATLVWGFSKGQGDARAFRSTTVDLRSGTKAHVTIPIDAKLNAYDYIQFDDGSCAGAESG